MRSDGVLQSFLQGKNPFHGTQALWTDGTLPLRVRYFLSNYQAPEELVTSVRCLVQQNESVLALRNRDGVHVLPGGRRQDEETLEQTLRREVCEETGWLVDNISLLGFMHLEHLGPKPSGYEFLYPHFLQVVYHSHASRHVPESMLGNDYEEEANFVQIGNLTEMGIGEAELAYVRAALNGN